MKVDIDKTKPKTIAVLKVIGVLPIIIGIYGFVVAIQVNTMLWGAIFLISALLTGSILIALGLIVEYLYAIVMKLYFDAKGVDADADSSST